MKHILFKAFQWIVIFPVFLVVTIIVSLITIVGSWLFGDRFWGYYPPRLWAKISCFLACQRVSVNRIGKIDKNQSYVFVANHQGAFDIFLIYGYLDHNFKWIMKSELGSIPFVGRACKIAGHIMLDDRNPRSIYETMEKALNELNKNMSIVIFPEGARTLTGRMGRFKRGGYQMAFDLGLPIVPLTIEGSFEAMKRGTYDLHPSHLKLTIHEPIPTKGLTQEDLPELMNRTKEIIASALPENRR
ncbi:MAG: lysophospholipid acyltransferase family protein [Bacteroidales bacterium]